MDSTQKQREWWSSPGSILSQSSEPLRFLLMICLYWIVPAIQENWKSSIWEENNLGQILRGFSSLRYPHWSKVRRLSLHTPEPTGDPPAELWHSLLPLPRPWENQSYQPQQSHGMSACFHSVDFSLIFKLHIYVNSFHAHHPKLT